MMELVLSFIAAMLAVIFVTLMDIERDLRKFVDIMYEEFEEEKEDMK